MDNMSFGEFILELRKSNNMTQKDLALKLGVTDKAVSKWERGICFPDIMLFELLAESLQVSVSELMQGKRFGEGSSISISDADKIVDDSIRVSRDEIMRKTKRNRKFFLFVSILFCIIFLILIFIIDKSRVSFVVEDISISENYKITRWMKTYTGDFYQEDILISGKLNSEIVEQYVDSIDLSAYPNVIAMKLNFYNKYDKTDNKKNQENLELVLLKYLLPEKGEYDVNY